MKINESKSKIEVTIKTKILSGVIASAALFVAYILCGHVFLFLHGMVQWSIFLLILGLVAIAISMISHSRKVMIATVTGYAVGFICGMLFNWYTYHPERGPGVYTNNNWVIWTFVFLLFIAIGIVWEFVSRHIKINR